MPCGSTLDVALLLAIICRFLVFTWLHFDTGMRRALTFIHEHFPSFVAHSFSTGMQQVNLNNYILSNGEKMQKIVLRRSQSIVLMRKIDTRVLVEHTKNEQNWILGKMKWKFIDNFFFVFPVDCIASWELLDCRKPRTQLPNRIQIFLFDIFRRIEKKRTITCRTKRKCYKSVCVCWESWTVSMSRKVAYTRWSTWTICEWRRIV